MKKQATVLSFLALALQAALPARVWRAGGVALVLLLAHAAASAQAIDPKFFGINYWYSGDAGPGGSQPGPALTNDLKKADLRWLRVGGHEFDWNSAWKNPAKYVGPIQYARSIGAEPIVQIPITLTKDELSSFVAYFSTNNITVTYWAIGNEPDPGNPDSTPYNDTDDWRNDVAAHPNEFGYTYSSWVGQYKTLAIRLKNDRPGCKLVGPDFRIFDNRAINDYFFRFIDNLGSSYWNGVPLLDYFAFHFYGDQPESVMQGRVGLVAQLLANVNNGGRATNGTAAPLRMALTEVNAYTKSAATDAKPWDFGAGQFVATMAKLLMKQNALCVTPWSVYESSANHGEYDQSLYDTEGSATVSPARRSTMWHLAMLSNYRQANVMPGTQSAETDHLVVLGMKGPAGFTVMIMNTQNATSYGYRASLDNVARGPETVQIALNGGNARQLFATIPPQTTHLYNLDASGNLLSKVFYSQGNAAPQQQLAFNFVSRSSVAAGTQGFARPTGGAATADVTQFVGSVAGVSSANWLLKPAAPGYYFVVNQYTDRALRPKGATDAERIQENQPIGQEALNETSLGQDYLQWRISYTGSGGYYRLQNKRSGKYLNVKGGGVTPDLPLVQYSYFADYLSEQWRFDEVNVTEPVQARGAALGASTAPAAGPGLSAYPNPATGTLYLALDADAGQATLRDLAGRVCLTQAVGRTGQVDIRNLAKGLYQLTVTTATGQHHQKIVKE
ncbi:hypothetical protein ACVWYF_003048 [Hymenobacter sp. UYAg731]